MDVGESRRLPGETTPGGPNGNRVTGGAFVLAPPNTPADTTGNIFNACFQNCVLPPDWLNNAAIPGGPCNSLGQWAFRSFHPGGVNFAMADGSVRFIKDTHQSADLPCSGYQGPPRSCQHAISIDVSDKVAD